MIVQQFFTEGIAHSSYLLGGTSSCAIVDPRRDVGIYTEAAKSLGMQITHVLETHLHADFVSGHLDLAEITGAEIYAPKSAECDFDHVPLVEGDSFDIEDMKLNVLETPGHTPEHISYVVADMARSDAPVSVFCGDTLFVGDVGRPDLFPGMAEELASMLYESLHNKLLKLPDFCEVYPAHGAGSLCGRSMGAKRTSTIGYERRYNVALQIEDREEFARSLITNMPGAPDHFSRCSEINRSGPALVRELPVTELLSPGDFKRKSDSEAYLVVDVRGYGAFGGHHIASAYSIYIGANFATFAGWIIPPDKNLLLVVEQPEQAEDAAIWLRRVGLDSVVGYLDGGMYSWAIAGLPTEQVSQLSVEMLHKMLTGDSGMVLVDVRAPSEYKQFHIEGAINIPFPDLRTRYKELDPVALTVLMCSAGHRSSMGTSILKRNGFNNLRNVIGGVAGYNAAGYAPICPVCFVPHGPRFMGEKKG
jgi:glyoxylase-like metal-dependent hydrolase (beta-lactamase superfamily II)/rhodanese-related sulfurtransferase